MKVVPTDFKDLFILEPTVLRDARGYFMESYNKHTLLKAGIDITFVQDNQSRSSKDVVRGLHFQRPPFAQTKLVRVLSGKILDIVVDLRKKEPTYGKTLAVELSGENNTQLLVPKGFAHGFLVLSDSAEVFYKCDEFYHPEADAGIHFTSADVQWPENPLVSPKDLVLPHIEKTQFDF